MESLVVGHSLARPPIAALFGSGGPGAEGRAAWPREAGRPRLPGPRLGTAPVARSPFSTRPWKTLMAAEPDGIALDAIVAPMRASDLFRSLDDAAAGRLARHLVRRRFRADEVIFHQGDPGDRLHIVESGRVRIGMGAADGREGTLTILGPGAAFGELVLLDGAYRSASAVALEPTTTVTLDRATFRTLMDEDPAIREAVLVGVSRWLRRLTDQIAELHFLDLRGRLTATLVRMARDHATGPGPVELPPLTQAELASMVASTRQRINGALGELAREGLVRVDGRCITVLDVDRLAARIGW